MVSHSFRARATFASTRWADLAHPAYFRSAALLSSAGRRRRPELAPMTFASLNSSIQTGRPPTKTPWPGRR